MIAFSEAKIQTTAILITTKELPPATMRLLIIAATISCAVATVIRPQDFGGIGDGVHNDTIAMRAAIAGCESHGGCDFKVDKGLTFLTGPISLPSNTRLIVAGTLLAAPIEQVVTISVHTHITTPKIDYTDKETVMCSCFISN